MDADRIIAYCARIAKQECEKFINPYSAALIADAITARANEIKSELLIYHKSSLRNTKTDKSE